MKKKKIWTRWLPPIVYGYYYYLITSLRTWPRHFQRPTARCSGAEVDAVPNDLHQNIVREYARIQIILFLHTKIQKKDKNRREGKGRSRCWLGDVLECRTKHLAAKMIRKKFLGEHPFWQGGLVWCEPDDHPFFQSIHSAKQPLFYSSFSSNHPCGKYLGQKQRRPLHSCLSLSFFYGRGAFFTLQLMITLGRRQLQFDNSNP